MNNVSFVIPVLDSHEVIRRELIYYNKFFPKHWELIIVDDGSDIPITAPNDITLNLKIIYTNDKTPWSQPRAHNIGASCVDINCNYILFTDVDHFFNEQCFKFIDLFSGDKLHFARHWGILNEYGELVTDLDILYQYGLKSHINSLNAGSHENTFLIKKDIFNMLNGYDEKFCGSHGGDDTDFNKRYGQLHYNGKVKRSERCPYNMHVFPDPARDIKGLFHKLRSKK
jgi:predicted glycosyltransferase involved in capsule biosynthesis